MKKIFAVLCSVFLLATALLPHLSDASVSAAEANKLLFDFDSFTDTEDLKDNIPYIATVEVSLDKTVKKGATGASMKMLIKDNFYNELVLGPKGDNGWVSDWSGHNALTFWVKADQAGGPEPGHKLEFKVKDRPDASPVALKAGGKVYLKGELDGTEKEDSIFADADGYIYLSTNFEGQITIPFSSLNSDSLDFGNMNGVYLCYGPYFTGTIVYFDDLALTNVEDEGDGELEDIPAVDSGKPAIVPENAILINDFDSYANDAELAEHVSAYNNSADVKLETEIQDGDGKSFSYTIKNDFAIVSIQNSKDLTGATGLRAWVKYHQRNPIERTFVKIWFAIDADGQRWHPAEAADYTLTNLYGEEIEVVDALITADGEFSVVIGTDFEGYIDIPFTSFTNGTGMYNPETNPIALDKVSQIVLQTGSYFNGSTIYVDSLYATCDELEIEEVEMTLIDDEGFFKDAVADQGAFVFDTSLTVSPVAKGSVLEENLLYDLKDYTGDDDFDKAIFLNLRALRTGTDVRVDIQSGKAVTLTAYIPEGFDPDKLMVVSFDGGEIKPLEAQVTANEVTFKVTSLGTIALIEYQAEPVEDVEDEEIPKTGDSNIYMYLLLLAFSVVFMAGKKGVFTKA